MSSDGLSSGVRLAIGAISTLTGTVASAGCACLVVPVFAGAAELVAVANLGNIKRLAFIAGSSGVISISSIAYAGLKVKKATNRFLVQMPMEIHLCSVFFKNTNLWPPSFPGLYSYLRLYIPWSYWWIIHIFFILRFWGCCFTSLWLCSWG